MANLNFEDIIYEKKDHIATITINRPEVRNAIRTQTYEELTEAALDAGEDITVGVIVIRGAGDQAFCSGGDVRDQKARGQLQGRALRAAARRHLSKPLALGLALRDCGKPVIAAVKGYCVGGGHELHIMCDITIAAENGIFAQVGPRVGSIPLWGATQILPRIIGEKRARELIFTCRRYTAQEAEAMGLVNKVVPLDQFDAAVDEMCQTILDKSPQALRYAKLSLNWAVDTMWPSFLDGWEVNTLLYGSEEQLEGAKAFLEKRPPNYRKFRDPLE